VAADVKQTDAETLTARREAWAHVAKVGDHLAALQPADDAVIERWGASARTWPVG
jgi:hypothetical protein